MRVRGYQNQKRVVITMVGSQAELEIEGQDGAVSLVYLNPGGQIAIEADDSDAKDADER